MISRIPGRGDSSARLAFLSFYLEKDMALMMVLMVILLVALPGSHMGVGALHHSPDQASQSHKSDVANPVHEETPQSAEHDVVNSNQENR